MAVFIVTYDLRSDADGQCYQQLIKLIKEEGSWACPGGSSYLIESNHSAIELRDKYKAVLDQNDMLYVGVVNAPAAWFGYSKEVTDWIKTKL